MRKKIVAALLVLALCTPALAMNDKAGHFAVGAGLGWVGTTAENGF